jgi:hypothetical protein
MSEPFTELNRQLAERSAVAQDAANTARRSAQARAKVHDLDTDTTDLRNWALAEARESSAAVRMGGPSRLLAWVNSDGSTNLRTDPQNPHKTVATAVHTDTPVVVGECRIWNDEEEEAFQRRQRIAENVLLAGRYDLGEMVAAGIMTEDEAAHPDVQAAAAARPKPVPGRHPPYDLEASVR